MTGVTCHMGAANASTQHLQVWPVLDFLILVTRLRVHAGHQALQRSPGCARACQ